MKPLAIWLVGSLALGLHAQEPATLKLIKTIPFRVFQPEK